MEYTKKIAEERIDWLNKYVVNLNNRLNNKLCIFRDVEGDKADAEKMAQAKKLLSTYRKVLDICNGKVYFQPVKNIWLRRSIKEFNTLLSVQTGDTIKRQLEAAIAEQKNEIK